MIGKLISSPAPLRERRGELIRDGSPSLLAERGLGGEVNLPQLTLLLSGAGLLALMFIANLRIGMLSARTLVYLTPMLMLVCGYGLSLIQVPVRDVLALALVVVSISTPTIIQPRLDSTA